jgi:HEAT repeat protein
MSEEERKLIINLATNRISKESFLQAFRGSLDGIVLSTELLDEALLHGDPTEVEMALIVGFVFGFDTRHLEALIRLESASWHVKHEDVVRALDKIRDTRAIPALVHATKWIPDYLKFDENRALAVKAIWALGWLNSREATDALVQLVSSTDTVLSKNAREQLQRRQPDQ